MNSAFDVAPEGSWTQMAPRTCALLSTLVREVLVVLDDPGDIPMLVAAVAPIDEPPAVPDDPALRALLPPLSDDPGLAASLRALTEDRLRTLRSRRLTRVLANLEAAAEVGGDVLLIPAGDEWEWIQAFHDLRLALAGELDATVGPEWREKAATPTANIAHGVGHVGSPRASVESAEFGAIEMFILLTWWQDSLLARLPETACSR